MSAFVRPRSPDLVFRQAQDKVLSPLRRGIALQRARGEGHIETQLVGGRTRLATLYQEGCAKIRLPNTHDESLQAVLINTAGGLTGGDRLAWSISAAPGSRLVLTTQACERIYRSTGDDAEITTTIAGGAAARLDWLPQETILFAGARLRRTLEVDLAADASFCAVEAVLLGRTAMGEDARDAQFGDSWRIRRDGRLMHAECTRLNGNPLERDALSLLDGAGAFATVLYVGSDAESRRHRLSGLLTGRSGASLIEDRLVVRVLAASGLALRRILAPIVAELSGAGTLPRLWHL